MSNSWASSDSTFESREQLRARIRKTGKVALVALLLGICLVEALMLVFALPVIHPATGCLLIVLTWPYMMLLGRHRRLQWMLYSQEASQSVISPGDRLVVEQEDRKRKGRLIALEAMFFATALSFGWYKKVANIKDFTALVDYAVVALLMFLLALIYNIRIKRY